MSDDYTDSPDTYWEQDAVNDRAEWDEHVRHVEDEARDRRERCRADSTADRDALRAADQHDLQRELK